MTDLVGPAVEAPLGFRLRPHPMRDILANEVHARPVTPAFAPERISHLALLTSETGATHDHEHLVRLCQRYGVTPPLSDLNHFSGDFGSFRVKWERHTEFTTFTFLLAAPFDDPFSEPAISRVAQDWLEEMPGALLVAVHVALMPRETAPPAEAILGRHLVANSLVSSRIAGGAATVYTDYRIHFDGFERILIHDHMLGNQQAGRLVQRLLEIETYRMMALLALPLARKAAPEIARIERELAAAMASMAAPDSAKDDRALLDDLVRLAADIERLATASSYRFGAARAYSALVDRRIGELREERVAGLQTIAEFMERRLRPAMQTCQSVAERQEDLAQRVARGSQLLRTRVDVALEEQNRDLLRSMDRRAQVQLLLEETVEGLSVVAITYYLLGLLSYALSAAKALHLPINPELVSGFALPFALAAVWWAVRHIRRRLVRQE